MPSSVPRHTMISPSLPPGAAGAAMPPAASQRWDFSFHNLLDIVNPLQHLPVIGTLYRAITGDTYRHAGKDRGRHAVWRLVGRGLQRRRSRRSRRSPARISATRCWRCSPAITATSPVPRWRRIRRRARAAPHADARHADVAALDQPRCSRRASTMTSPSAPCSPIASRMSLPDHGAACAGALQ